jgi:SAM-dependent methyltransferase
VLEVGGSTPPKMLQSYAPAQWTSVNLNDRDINLAKDEARELNLSNYSAIGHDITTFDNGELYDLVYSINAFEHIHDLDVACEKMYARLAPGGYMFALFGPIWSCDVGHHLSISLQDNKAIHFLDGTLGPWEHLTSTPEAIHEKITAAHGESVAEKVVTFIYDYPDLNRLFERDYLKLIDDSDFNTVLILRNKHGTPPDLDGATSTRELMIVLKKGPVSVFEKLACTARFAWMFGIHKLRSYLSIDNREENKRRDLF